jgi:hypothetical protein
MHYLIRKRSERPGPHDFTPTGEIYNDVTVSVHKRLEQLHHETGGHYDAVTLEPKGA